MYGKYATFLLLLLVVPRPARAQSSWDRYEKRTITSIIASEDSGVRAVLGNGGTSVVVSGADFPTRTTVVFLDSVRTTPSADMKVLSLWAKAIGSHFDPNALFPHEMLFREDSLLLWIPVYDSLIGDLQHEIQPGELATLYVTYHGAAGPPNDIHWMFTVNDFSGPEPPFPPSQRELGGFLIGQSLRAIEASFTKRIQVDTSQDGWVDRAYLVDPKYRAYMAFKFAPDRPANAISVQVAGDSGTPLSGVLGVYLGDSRDTLIARVGRPTRITHEDDVNVDLFSYDGRNYSFEVDSTGRVNSIQLMGFEGFPDSMPGVDPSLDSLAAALDAGGTAALNVLSPELEIYLTRRKTVAFAQGALRDLADSTGALHRALISGPRSVVRVISDSAIRGKADESVRVWEHSGVGRVWKFSAPAPIAELVMKVEAGRWVLWEVTYR